MTLSNASSGSEVTLKAIHAGRGLRARLYSMGLTPGTRFFILHQDPCGRLIIRVRGSRFALGHGMAEKMAVE
ncbi:MAG: FeoA family protein [Acidobacteriota bacterium]|jgi:Fe2+ transport system protein FeoA|nr:FeoA family protein [Acidobacteriota bacterium]